MISPAPGAYRLLATRRLALAYHALDDGWDNPLALSPERFARQVAVLREAGFVGVRFTDLARHPEWRGVVAITFDDAFGTVIEHGLPVLREAGWPATVFASSSVVDAGDPMRWLLGARGTPPASDALLRPLSWDALRGLAEEGWEIGSHGATHRRLSGLEADDRQRELSESRARIAAETGACTAISYPWGEVDDEVVAEAARAGYTAGSGLGGQFVAADPMRVPRFAIARRDGDLRFLVKATVTIAALRRSACWPLVESIRRRDFEPDGDVERTTPAGPHDVTPSEPATRAAENGTPSTNRETGPNRPSAG